MFARLRNYLRRRKYTIGARLSRFVACDVRRDVEIVETSKLDQGYVTARIRTWNVLYVMNGMATVPDFGVACRVAIKELWMWTGQPWGGPVPDDDISGAKPKN